MLTSRSARCEYRRGKNKPQGNLNSRIEWGETVGVLRPRTHVGLHCFVDVRRDRCVVCQGVGGGGVTYSIAPAAQQVVGHGVLRLQLDGFIQMILGGEADMQTDRQEEKGESFFFFCSVDSWHGCYFHCLLFWPDLSCFTNPQVFHKHLSHTRSRRATTHSCLSRTLPRSFPLSLALSLFLRFSFSFFFHIFPLCHSISLFHLSRVLQVHSVWGEKPLTEDKMLRAVDPHAVLCNCMAVGVALCVAIPLYSNYMREEVMSSIYTMYEKCILIIFLYLKDVSVPYLVLYCVVFCHHSTHDGIPVERPCHYKHSTSYIAEKQSPKLIVF